MEYYLLKKTNAWNKKKILTGGLNKSNSFNKLNKLNPLNTFKSIIDDTSSLNVQKAKNNIEELIDIVNEVYTLSLKVDDHTAKELEELTNMIQSYNKDYKKKVHSFENVKLKQEFTKIIESKKLSITEENFTQELLKLFNFLNSIESKTHQELNGQFKNNIETIKKLMKSVTEFNETIDLYTKNLSNAFLTFNYNKIIVLQEKEKKAVYSYTVKYTDTVEEDINDTVINSFNNFMNTVVTRQIVDNSFISKVNRQYMETNNQMQQIQNIINNTQNKVGGNITTIDNINIINNNLINIIKLIKDLKLLVYKSIESVKRYREFRRQIGYFSLYFELIISTYGQKENVTRYRYINKGIIQFNLSIIKTILKKIKQGNKSKPIQYFEYYHYITLITLEHAFEYIIKNIKTEDIMDIYSCSGDLLKALLIFIHFDQILVSYNLIFQNDVMIYARINDWDTQDIKWTDDAKRMFIKDKDDARVLVVQQDVCNKKLNSLNSINLNKTTFRFNEVFDTIEFKDNPVISKYMTLEDKISRNTGIMLITYGYSGTGKTFTLFGNNEKQGIMQSTLGNVTDLKKLSFRVYEYYGIGVQYPHYWAENKKVYKKIFGYPLELATYKDKEKNIPYIKVFEPYEYSTEEKISSFINKDELFLELDTTDVLKTFNKTIETIDNIRKKNGRIIKTPNNPESSRSIIVYEFQCMVDKQYIPLIIIDLPGREEIVDTYTRDFLQKKGISDEIRNNEYNKALLSSISINPLYTSILAPCEIIKGFNTLDLDTRIRILTSQISLDGAQYIFEKEYFAKASNGGHLYLSYIYDFTSANWLQNYKFDTVDIKQNNKTYQHIKIKGVNSANPPHHSKQVHVNINSVQYEGTLALHLINRIISLGEFDVLKHINEYVVNDKINTKIQDKSLKYEYFMAPYEGVFINENIIGLVKILGEKVSEKTKKNTSNLVEKQNVITFFEQKTGVREINFELYTENPMLESTKYENIYMNKNELNVIYDRNKSDYSSQKIFNYDEPIIKQIIDNYTREKLLNDNILTVGVKDFKVFYLFTNNDNDKKCLHQFKLLLNTENLISSVEN